MSFARDALTGGIDPNLAPSRGTIIACDLVKSPDKWVVKSLVQDAMFDHFFAKK